MKILVIAKNLEMNAAGIIYKKFIDELLTYDDIEVEIVSNIKEILADKENKIYTVPKQDELDERISKLFVMAFRYNLNGIFWLQKGKSSPELI